MLLLKASKLDLLDDAIPIFGAPLLASTCRVVQVTNAMVNISWSADRFLVTVVIAQGTSAWFSSGAGVKAMRRLIWMAGKEPEHRKCEWRKCENASA